MQTNFSKLFSHFIQKGYICDHKKQKSEIAAAAAYCSSQQMFKWQTTINSKKRHTHMKFHCGKLFDLICLFALCVRVFQLFISFLFLPFCCLSNERKNAKILLQFYTRTRACIYKGTNEPHRTICDGGGVCID